MPVPLLKDPQMQFGALTFFAKQHKGDTCGSNGLPLTPNSIILIGKAQFLKTIEHPYLCQYLDIFRSKHERTIVVSQYCGKPLSACIEKETLDFEQVKRIAFQLVVALNEMHKREIVHRNLSSENILLQHNGDVKLFNYGLYHMTDRGRLVSFPIMQVLYSAPEVYLDKTNVISSHPKVDIWSLGIILIELILNKPLWSSLKLGQKIRKVLSLIQCNTSVFEKISREHNCYEIFQNTPDQLKNIIESCLSINPKDRPTSEELLKNEFFKDMKVTKPSINSKICEPFEIFTIKELYHWWQLAGGDVFQELKKQGLIRSSPPILSLPSLVLIEGSLLGQERNPATLYDSRIVQMPLDSLYQRFQHIPFNFFYPLLLNKSKIIESAAPPPYDVTGLPLVIREKDPEYQFHRIILFRRLLHGYPYTKDMILKEAQIDIPPLLRGEIWSCLLEIKGDYKREYLRIDKETSTATDRQIEVDIPRCHQYNELLSSTEGHKKLKRILKAWVHKNAQYVYWQGLDSLTAPFLYLNFKDEARAFACLSAFIPKYLHKFFLKDNSAVIQEYLAKFSQLIAFHDPDLANHLHDINFYPELFAIPWFLTVFSHVFPLYKILHLWDKLLLGDSSFSLYIGLSVLTQLRDRLLTSGFNECILLFSDLPEVDIEKCINYSIEKFKSTPRSITAREHQNEKLYSKTELDISGITLQELNRERCPRISAADLVDLIRNSPEKLLIIDIRNPTKNIPVSLKYSKSASSKIRPWIAKMRLTDLNRFCDHALKFNRCCARGSINIPFSSVSFNETNLDSVGQHGSTIRNSQDRIVAIVGDEETDFELFPKFLLKCGVSKICVLHGGFNILLPIAPTVLMSHNQI